MNSDLIPAGITWLTTIRSVRWTNLKRISSQTRSQCLTPVPLRSSRPILPITATATCWRPTLPGFDKKDIKLDINGDWLTINAERHSEHEEKDKKDKYICCERSYGSYSRRFNVSGVKTDEIKAKYDNGVLKLTLPKKGEELPESHHLEIE